MLKIGRYRPKKFSRATLNSYQEREFAKFPLQPLLHKSPTTKHPPPKTTQANKTVNNERNNKMFADPVFINPGRYILKLIKVVIVINDTM